MLRFVVSGNSKDQGGRPLIAGRKGEGKDEEEKEEGFSELHNDRSMEMESETSEHYTKFQ